MVLPTGWEGVASERWVWGAVIVIGLVWLALIRPVLLRLVRRVSRLITLLLGRYGRRLRYWRHALRGRHWRRLASRERARLATRLMRQLQYQERREPTFVAQIAWTEDRLEQMVGSLSRRVNDVGDDQQPSFSREEAETAMAGWRRVIRLQGDLGRRVRDNAERQAELNRQITILRRALAQPGTAVRLTPGPPPVLHGALLILAMAAVLAAAGWLLMPGVATLVPGLEPLHLVGVELALLMALVITAQAFLHGVRSQAVPAGLIRGLGAGLLTAWTVVLAFLAHDHHLPTAGAAAPSLVPALQALLGGAIPWWLTLVLAAAPRVTDIPLRLISGTLDAVLGSISVFLQLVQVSVLVLEQTGIALVDALTWPLRWVTIPLRPVRK